MGTTTSKEDNDDLVDYLVSEGSIKSKDVERAFRLVDRGRYVPPAARQEAYKDAPYRQTSTDPAVNEPIEASASVGMIHLSAPTIYTDALEHLQLEKGQTFLNIGSGTGYLNTVIGFMIGSSGTNHGIEYYDNLVDFANKKLEETLTRPEINCYDFAIPTFCHGNGLLIADGSKEFYDRIYIGAAIDEEALQNFGKLLKIGGQLVAPIENLMICYRRLSADDFQQKHYSNVTFASLLPISANTQAVVLPNDSYVHSSLRELCRNAIRQAIREKAHLLVPVEMQQKVGELHEEVLESDDRPANSLVLHVASREGGRPRPIMIGLRPEAFPYLRRARQELDDAGPAQDELDQEPQEADQQNEDALRIRRARLLRALMLGERDYEIGRRARRLREISAMRRRIRGEFEAQLRDGEAPAEEDVRRRIREEFEAQPREGGARAEEDVQHEEGDDHLIFSSDTSNSNSDEEEVFENEAVDMAQQQVEGDIPLMDGIVEDRLEREEQEENVNEESTETSRHESDEVEAQPNSSQEPEPPRASSPLTTLHLRLQAAMQSRMSLEDDDNVVPTEEHCPKRRRMDSDAVPSSDSADEQQRLLAVQKQRESLINCSQNFNQLLDQLKLPKNLKHYCKYGISMEFNS